MLYSAVFVMILMYNISHLHLYILVCSFTDMVVSGLPVLNKDKHADEIAELSLGLVDEIKAIMLKNYPDKQLHIRTGIHTGLCSN